MRDLAAVLSSVRAKQEVLASRRDQLESQLAEVDREQGRLAAAVSVMEEHLRARSGSPASEQRASGPRLVDQILDELARSPGQTRADLLRVFADRNANTVSAAVARLCKRGAVVNNAGHYSRAVQGPEQDASGSPADVDSSRSDLEQRPSDDAALPHEVDRADSGSVRAGPVSDARVTASSSAPHPSGSGKNTKRARVWDAVATSAVCTRPALVEFFAPRGLTEDAVDTALAGLKKRGVIEQRADGVLVALSPSGDSPTAAGVSPPGS